MPFELANWMFVFLRVSALLTVFPVFSTRNIPIQLRVALGALTAFLIAPNLAPLSFAGLAFIEVVGLMAKEIIVGLVIGFFSRMVFYALEMAGVIISTEMGLAMAQLYNPLTESTAQPPGTILFYLGAVLFLCMDFHHWLLFAFRQTYDVLPIGGAVLADALMNSAITATSRLFLVSLLMAAPMITISFLVALIFAVLGRAVPQMNVFVESFAVKTLSGMMVFGMTLNLLAIHIINYLRRLPEDVLNTARLLRG